MKGAVAKSKSIISFYKNYYVKSNNTTGGVNEEVQITKESIFFFT